MEATKKCKETLQCQQTSSRKEIKLQVKNLSEKLWRNKPRKGLAVPVDFVKNAHVVQLAYNYARGTGVPEDPAAAYVWA